MYLQCSKASVSYLILFWKFMRKMKSSDICFVSCALTQIFFCIFFTATFFQLRSVLVFLNTEQWRCGIYWIMLCHVTMGFLHDRRSLKSFKGHAVPKEVNGNSPPWIPTEPKNNFSNFFCQVGDFHITHEWWQKNLVLAGRLALFLSNAASLQSIFRKRIFLLILV